MVICKKKLMIYDFMIGLDYLALVGMGWDGITWDFMIPKWIWI